MSKKKNRSTNLQGMEHLRKYIAENTSNTYPINSLQNAKNSNNGYSIEHTVLRKELFTVILVMSFLFFLLIGLMTLDKTTNYLLIISEKIANLLIK